MWLSDVVSSMQNTAGTFGINNNADPAANARLNRLISSMKTGQTFQGEIVSKDGNTVLIKLSDDLTMPARLESDANLELGKLITLEVRSNIGGTLSLSPLFENMGTDANVIKALNMAGLPINDNTIEMADAMMKNGMNVGKENLTEVFKEVITFRQSVPPREVVELHKLGIEVNKENIEQFNNYKNLNHQVIKGMTDVIENLPETLKSLVLDGKSEEAVNLFDGVIKTVITEESVLPPNVSEVIINEEAENVENSQPIMVENAESEATPVNPNVVVNEENFRGEATAERADVILQNKEEIPDDLMEKSISLNPSTKSENVTAPNSQVVSELIDIYNKAITKEEKIALFENKDFQNLLKEAVVEKWSLTPEMIFDKDNVTKLYEKLRNELTHLEITAEENSNGSGTPFSQSVTTLNNNLDFMNQINQLYTYVQLPLKMANGENHGELYVYTNKHSLASKDGAVSAFLHLDMDNLGPVDVFVTMQNMKVNTNFKLKDDETLKFIEDHMDILNSRLAKRGYSLTSKCDVSGEEVKAVEEMLKEDSLKIFGGHHSFDVRT